MSGFVPQTVLGASEEGPAWGREVDPYQDALALVKANKFSADDVRRSIKEGGYLLEALHVLYIPKLRWWGRVFLQSRGDEILISDEALDDFAADVFECRVLVALENGSFWRGDSRFSTWLFKVALNHARGILRRHKFDKSLDTPLSDDPNSVDALSDTLAAPEHAPEVMRGPAAEAMEGLSLKALGALTPAERQIVLLMVRDEVPAKVVAERMGIALSVVYYRYNRGLEKLGWEYWGRA